MVAHQRGGRNQGARLSRRAVVCAGLAGVILGGSRSGASGAADAARDAAVMGAAITGVEGRRTLVLADGRRLRLAGVLPPALGEPGAGEARAALQAAAVGAHWMDAEGTLPDRWGREVGGGLVERAGERLSLAQALVEMGWARVAPEPAARPFIDALLAREAEARGAGRGLWALDAYRVLEADAVAATLAGTLAAEMRGEGSLLGAYHLLEGEVLQASLAGGRLFLNFGADYRTDLTGLVEDRDRAALAAIQGIATPGSRVRLRGVLEHWNGPLVRLHEAAQCERLSDTSGLLAP